MKGFRFAVPALAALLVSCGEAPTAIPAPEGGVRHGWTVRVDVSCPAVMYVGDRGTCWATGYDDDGHVTYTYGTWDSSDPYTVWVDGVGTVWAMPGAWPRSRRPSTG
jgi:hypothetical protein